MNGSFNIVSRQPLLRLEIFCNLQEICKVIFKFLAQRVINFHKSFKVYYFSWVVVYLYLLHFLYSLFLHHFFIVFLVSPFATRYSKNTKKFVQLLVGIVWDKDMHKSYGHSAILFRKQFQILLFHQTGVRFVTLLYDAEVEKEQFIKYCPSSISFLSFLLQLSLFPLLSLSPLFQFSFFLLNFPDSKKLVILPTSTHLLGE